MKDKNFTNVYDENKKRYIKKANLYVISVDTFMSGWGKSEGKTNICIVPFLENYLSEAKNG